MRLLLLLAAVLRHEGCQHGVHMCCWVLQLGGTFCCCCLLLPARSVCCCCEANEHASAGQHHEGFRHHP
jgi:hypothetical protein